MDDASEQSAAEISLTLVLKDLFTDYSHRPSSLFALFNISGLLRHCLYSPLNKTSICTRLYQIPTEFRSACTYSRHKRLTQISTQSQFL